MGCPVVSSVACKQRAVIRQGGGPLNEKPESSLEDSGKGAEKALPAGRPFSFDLLVDLGSHEGDDDHDTKKTSNNGENGAVKTSHVILLAFGLCPKID